MAMVLASCTDNEAMHQRLSYVSQCNRADTVFTEAWLPTVDSLVHYFDRYGNANEKMMAHYLKGRVYCDIGDAPQALKCYQQAMEMADTTDKDCDFYQLMVIHGQMSEIFQKQNLPIEGATELKKANQYAIMLNDTISSFIYHQRLAVSFYELGQVDSVFIISDKLSSLEKDQKSISYSVMLPIRTALESHDYINAKKYIDKFNCESFDERNGREGNTLGLFYANLGRYYMETGKIDSALYYYKRSQILCKGASHRLVLSHGLFDLYKKMGLKDSICKYADLYTQLTDSSLKIMKTDAIIQSQSAYNYQLHLRKAEQSKVRMEKTKLVAIILSMVLLLIVLLSYMAIRRIKQRNKERIIKLNAEYNQYLQNYTHIKNEYEQLSRQKDNLSNYVQEKEKEMEVLRQALSSLHDIDSQSQFWEMEETLLSTDIVIKFHDMAAKGQKAGMAEWNTLRGFVNVFMPNFIKALSEKNEKINLKETNLCILIRLQFIPSEIATLMDSSAQSLSNLRVRLLHKMFKMEGTAKDFNEQINKIDIL